MKRKAAILLAVCLLFSLLPLAGETGVYADFPGQSTEDTFEEYLPGLLLPANAPGWSWSTTAADVQAVEDAGNTYIRVTNKPALTGNNILTRELNAPLSGLVAVEFSVRVNNEEYHQIPILTGTGTGNT